MYVNNIKIKNYGSIEEFEIKANLNEDGSPKPIILMGKNGSGKTLLLSQIIQAILLYIVLLNLVFFCMIKHQINTK